MTKQLVLLRHAKASHDELGGADFERPLSARGKQEADQIAQQLKAAELSIDAIVTSPAERAYDTAQVVAGVLEFPVDEILTEESIYEASVETLLDLIRDLDDGDHTVLLVGHNPGFSDVINELSIESLVALPTAGVCVLLFDAPHWIDVSASNSLKRSLFSPEEAAN